METYFTFKNIGEFEKFLQKKEWEDGQLDYINVGGLIYTMDEYDFDGKYLQWGNKKHDKLIRADTANRYHSWKDAKVWLFEDWGVWRNDISYHE